MNSADSVTQFVDHGPGIYVIYVDNNEGAAERGMRDEPDTFDEYRHQFKSWQDVLEFAVNLHYDSNDSMDSIFGKGNWSAETLLDELYKQDTGDGSPVVYGIKKNNDLVFDFYGSFDYFETLRAEAESWYDDEDAYL